MKALSMASVSGYLLSLAEAMPYVGPYVSFNRFQYSRINQRRLEHLATLALPIAGKQVLELGAGIGDLTSFFLDRECRVVAVEGRRKNRRVFNQRYGSAAGIVRGDLDLPDTIDVDAADVVFCYGLLYHLRNPATLILWAARQSKELFLVETCVSLGTDELVKPVVEPRWRGSQALGGRGSKPTRVWVFRRLQEVFEHVYVPATQPAHDEFPLDWRPSGSQEGKLTRAIFIGSRYPLEGHRLMPELPMCQTR